MSEQEELYKQAICSSLKIALESFLEESARNTDLYAITVRRRKVEDLVSILEAINSAGGKVYGLSR